MEIMLWAQQIKGATSKRQSHIEVPHAADGSALRVDLVNDADLKDMSATPTGESPWLLVKTALIVVFGPTSVVSSTKGA